MANGRGAGGAPMAKLMFRALQRSGWKEAVELHGDEEGNSLEDVSGGGLERDFQSPALSRLLALVQITGPQPLAGEQIRRVQVRDPHLNPSTVGDRRRSEPGEGC